MRFASLGSGSEGNALAVQAGNTCVLLDCGFSITDTIARLARLNFSAENLSGIVVSHEHGDHIKGVAHLAQKFSLPVWMTHGTRQAYGKSLNRLPLVTEISPQHGFSIGDLQIQPYAVPHDAVEPVQYVFGDGSKRLGVLTDSGSSTPHIEATLKGCDALVLEFNHDTRMLANGSYPHHLKQRIAGRFGHLSNDAAASLLRKLNHQGLQHVVAAHLSSKNNTIALATEAVGTALDCSTGWISVATQKEGMGWRELL